MIFGFKIVLYLIDDTIDVLLQYYVLQSNDLTVFNTFYIICLIKHDKIFQFRPI